MKVGKKARGNIRKGIDLLIQEFNQLRDDVDEDFVMITHSLAYDSYLYIKDNLKEISSIKNLYETDAGCVISSHCGKGTIGILYIMK